MKKKLALFSILTVMVMGFSFAPSYAHSGHSNTGAVVAGSILGLTAGAIIGSSISNGHHTPPPHHGMMNLQKGHHHMTPPPPPHLGHGGGFYHSHRHHHGGNFITFGW